MNISCKIYSFLRAVRGNWRNAIFVSCDCGHCMCGRTTPCFGFLLAVDECGQVTYNDWNRKIIDAYRERYGAAYLGRINYSGNQRQRIADGTESVFEAYTGQPLYNFCCDFCVSAPDRTLEELIRHWNNAAVPLSEKKVDAIMDRIQVLCGQTFIWY